MTTSSKLPTDTYYRGYRLSQLGEDVAIYRDADHIDTAVHMDHAKMLIDQWMTAP